MSIREIFKKQASPWFIFVFSFFLSIANAPYISYAQDSAWTFSDDQILLDPIVISARRVPSYTGRTAENVAVYTQKDIQETPAKNLGEVLSYIPGVDVAVRNKLGQSTSITIQGSRSRHVLVMVDGIPFNTQLSGQANPAKIPLENVKQIEVVKGSSSSSWGSSLGGVINIITQDVGDTVVPKGSVTSTFAEFETQKYNGDLRGKVGPVGYYIFGSHMETDGIRAFSDVEENKFFGKLAYAFSEETKIEGSFGFSGANVRDGVLPTLNQIKSMPYYARYGKIEFGIEKPESRFTANVKFNDQDITSDTFDGTTLAQNVSLSTFSHNLYRGIGLNGSLLINKKDTLAYGVDLDWNTLKSPAYLTSSKSVATQAPYLNYTLGLDKWDVNLGLRHDHNSFFGNQTSPSLGAVYHFRDSRDTRIKTKISRAFNAPPLLWAYNDNSALLVGPNPHIKPERSTVYELGAETTLFSHLNADLNLYWAEVKDAIAAKYVVAKGQVVQLNFDKVRRRGVNLTLNYKVSPQWRFSASGAFNHVVDLQTNKVVRDNGTARQSYRLGTHYKSDKGFGFHLYGYYDRWDAEPAGNDRKFIFDAKFTQEFKDVYKNVDAELFLNIYNVGDSSYWSNENFPLPKRYFEGGFTVKF